MSRVIVQSSASDKSSLYITSSPQSSPYMQQKSLAHVPVIVYASKAFSSYSIAQLELIGESQGIDPANEPSELDLRRYDVGTPWSFVAPAKFPSSRGGDKWSPFPSSFTGRLDSRADCLSLSLRACFP